MSNQPFFGNPNIYSSPSTGDGSVSIATGVRHLVGMIVENNAGSTRWVQVFDAISLPANGTVPILEMKLSPGAQGTMSAADIHSLAVVSTGLFIASSSTGNTLTFGANTDLWMTVYSA